LKSELSFTGGGQECLSRISENVVDYASAAAGNGSLHTSTNTWGGGPDNNNNNNSNSIVFSSSQTQTNNNNNNNNNNSKKRSSRTDTNDDPDLLLHCLNALETQVLSLFTILILSFLVTNSIFLLLIQYSLPQTSLEMDQLMHNIPQDSVPCKIRAKRGCATHPRSIAERVINSFITLLFPFSFCFCFKILLSTVYNNSIAIHVCRREELE
jgi:hypothetical protein